MSVYCQSSDNYIQNTLALLDNEVFGTLHEKVLLETIRNREIAIRRSKDMSKWERCPNTEGVLENEHLVKTLVSDSE